MLKIDYCVFRATKQQELSLQRIQSYMKSFKTDFFIAAIALTKRQKLISGCQAPRTSAFKDKVYNKAVVS